jgi:hypothetical protein
VVQQQPHAVGEAVVRGGHQLVLGHLRRRGMRRREQAVPAPALAAAEPVLEQQLQPAVVGISVAVVQRLRVVGLSAGVEQQPRQRRAVRVRGRVPLAPAERAGQGREGRAQPLPQIPAFGSAPCSSSTRAPRPRSTPDLCLAASSRRDTSAARSRAGRPGPGPVTGRARAHRVPRQPPRPRRSCGCSRARSRDWRPAASGPRPSELDHRRRRSGRRGAGTRRPRPLSGDGPAGGLAVGRARVGPNGLQMRPELRPARKAEAACDHQLRIRAREPG